MERITNQFLGGNDGSVGSDEQIFYDFSDAGDFFSVLEYGGSALKGETEYQCVRRELLEEPGLQCDAFQLYDVVVSEHNHCIYYQFSCVTACDKQSVQLQEGETVSYRWVDLNGLQAMFDTGEIVPVTRERMRKYLEGVGKTSDSGRLRGGSGRVESHL